MLKRYLSTASTSRALLRKRCYITPGKDEQLDTVISNSIEQLPQKYRRKKNASYQVPQKASVEEAIEWINRRATTVMCLDLEWFERDSKSVTEIGISIYDPLNQHHSIVPNIQTYHFIVAEKIKKINKKFVTNNKERFIGSGSFVLPRIDIGKIVAQLMRKYTEKADPELSPPLVLMAHDIHGDIKGLRSTEMEIPGVPIIETQELVSSLKFSEKKNLSHVLRKLSFPHTFLHNAGNDAYYTLMMGLYLASPQVRAHFFSENQYTQTIATDDELANISEIELGDSLKANANFVRPIKISLENVMNRLNKVV